MSIYPNGIGVGIKANGLGAVDGTQQSGEDWLEYGWELPLMVRGK